MRRTALWYGIFIGPLTLAASQLLGFILVPWCCATGLHAYLWIAPAIALLLTLEGTYVCWRESQEQHDQEYGHFLALGGMLLSLMFALAIIAQTIPTFILTPCQ